VWTDLSARHDKLAAVLKYAFEDEMAGDAVAFHDNDRWVARFQPDGWPLALHDRGMDDRFRAGATMSRRSAKPGKTSTSN